MQRRAATPLSHHGGVGDPANSTGRSYMHARLGAAQSAAATRPTTPGTSHVGARSMSDLRVSVPDLGKEFLGILFIATDLIQSPPKCSTRINFGGKHP